MSATAQKFSCGGCGNELTWKQEFVGRKIKCKSCGHAMAIPPYPNGAEPEPEPEAQASEDDLYALADDARNAAANIEPTIVDPAEFQQAVPAAAVAAVATGTSKSGIPLAYRRGPTAAEKKRDADSSQIDKNRDIKVPIALLAAGAILYVSYYAIHYGLGLGPLLAISIGLLIMTVFETILLFGFGLAIAGPLGVNFEGIWTALLKFAAIALFCDGITTWVDGMFATWTGGVGGGGIFGFGVIGLPVAAGVYWVTMTYLFTMDPGDAWLVVIIIAVFSRIVSVVLIILILKLVLSFGGVAAANIPLPTFGGGGAVSVSPIIDTVNQAKAQNLLHEARQYADTNGLSAYKSAIEGWYKAGAKNVWFETDRDINGKGNAFRMVVEMPSDATSRTNCYAVLKQYYTDMGWGALGQGLQDTGDPYLLVPLP